MDHQATSGPHGGQPKVAYVMTHFPRVALTFVSLEVRQLERTGLGVVPIAINPPTADDLANPLLTEQSRATTYLKALGATRLGIGALRTFLRHPARMTSLARLAVTSSRLDLPVMARRLVHLAYAATVWQVAARRGVRHFHAHFGQAPATVAWFAAEIGSVASGERCTWSFTIHGFQDFADERVTRLDLKAKSASFVCCVSDFTRAQLCRVTQPDTWDRYHVVRCGIDLDAFPFRPPVAEPGRTRIVTVARLSPEKGHLVLLEALRRLRDRGHDVDLQIIGDGPSGSLIQKTAADLGLTDRVVLSGELDSAVVSRELAAADVFCLASFAEGIPVSIMEAMAIGLPVVTTFVGGIPELAINERTALVVPASNAEYLADAIERLITDGDLRRRITQDARDRVCELHDARRNADELRSLLASPTKAG